MDNYISFCGYFTPTEEQAVMGAVRRGLYLDVNEDGTLCSKLREGVSEEEFISKAAIKVLSERRPISMSGSTSFFRCYSVKEEDMGRLKRISANIFSLIGAAASSSTEATSTPHNPFFRMMTKEEVSISNRKQEEKIDSFIKANHSIWREKAEENIHGMFLMKPKEGDPLHDTVKALLVARDGRVFIRHWNSKFMGSGSFKEVYEVTLQGTKKTYAWSEFNQGTLSESLHKNSVISRFRRVIDGNPAFSQPGKLLEFEDALSVEEAYEGDALNLRLKSDDPVLGGKMIIKLAEGLAYIHTKNYAHCDIKLENILIQKGDAVWHDYDFVKEVIKGELVGLQGTIFPLEMIEISLRNQKLDAASLPKIDVFAFAHSLLSDLFKRIFYLDETALHCEIDGICEKLDRDVAEETDKDVTEEKRVNDVCEELKKRNLKRHKEGIPNLQGEYSEYIKLLWEGIHPDPSKRPNSDAFTAALKVLYAEGKLPVDRQELSSDTPEN